MLGNIPSNSKRKYQASVIKVRRRKEGRKKSRKEEKRKKGKKGGWKRGQGGDRGRE